MRRSFTLNKLGCFCLIGQQSGRYHERGGLSLSSFKTRFKVSRQNFFAKFRPMGRSNKKILCQFEKNCYREIYTSIATCVTRLSDLLHFGQFFKACGSKYFAHILGNFCKVVKICYFSCEIIFGELFLVTLIASIAEI